MASTIARDSINNGTGGTGTSFTYSHTCSGNNRVLIVGVRGGGGEGDKVSGITYGGVALTRIDKAFTLGGTSGEMAALWYIKNPASGTNNVVVSMSSSGFLEVGSVSYSGVYQVNPIDNSTIKEVTTDAASATTDLSVGNQWCWTVLVGKNSAYDIAAGTGSTLTSNLNSGGARMADSNGFVTKGTVSMTLNRTGSGASSKWAIVMCSIRPLPEVRRTMFI